MVRRIQMRGLLRTPGTGVMLLLAAWPLPIACGGDNKRAESPPPQTTAAAKAVCPVIGARAIRNGRRSKGPEHVVGRDPVLLAGMEVGRATPALLTRTGASVEAKIYFMYRKSGPPTVVLRGWLRGERTTPMLFLNRSRKLVPELRLQRSRFGPERVRRDATAKYIYQLSGLQAPRAGCYVVEARLPDGTVRLATVDLTEKPGAAK